MSELERKLSQKGPLPKPSRLPRPVAVEEFKAEPVLTRKEQIQKAMDECKKKQCVKRKIVDLLADGSADERWVNEEMDPPVVLHVQKLPALPTAELREFGCSVAVDLYLHVQARAACAKRPNAQPTSDPPIDWRARAAQPFSIRPIVQSE